MYYVDDGYEICMWEFWELIGFYEWVLFLLFMVVVGFFLVFVCVNVVNVQLGCGVVWFFEVSVVQVLGVGWVCIFLELMIELVFLVGVGFVVVFVLVKIGERFFFVVLFFEVLWLGVFSLDGWVVVFMVVVVFVMMLLFGFWLVLIGSCVGVCLVCSVGCIVCSCLLFVVLQVVMVVVLFVGCGMVLCSIQNLVCVDLGFEMDGFFVLILVLFEEIYDEFEKVVEYYVVVEQLLCFLFGVIVVGVVECLLFFCGYNVWLLQFEG